MQAAETEECQMFTFSSTDYSLGLHLFGLALVLLASASSIFLALHFGRKQNQYSISQHIPSNEKSSLLSKWIHLSKMFGIGVIAGTAWCHLIPEATKLFSSPCLETFWSGFGEHWTGVFALISTFLVQQIELRGCSHSHSHGSSHFPTSSFESSVSSSSTLPCKDQSIIVDPKQQANSIPSSSQPISTWILEIGVLSHSFIIGLTLGWTPDSSFYTLLIAFSIHQFFEGLALGLFLADSISKSVSSKKIISMGLLYPITTPLGIGLAIISRSFFEISVDRLVLILAICDSLSSGILIYNTYCELFGNHISKSLEFQRIKGSFRIACFLSLYLGAAAMAFLAKWA